MAVVSFASIACIAGCSTWKTNESLTVPRLPRSQMSPDSVGVEIASVTLNTSDTQTLRSILLQLDEQVVDANMRRHLAQNGLVAGALGTQLPSEIQLLLLEAADRREYPTAINQRDPPDQQRFVQTRAGKRVGIGLWQAMDQLEAKHHDGELVIPDVFKNAAPQMGMRCRQVGSNTALVRLLPEIEHGLVRQKYVVEGESFHIESRQDRAEYKDLEIGIQLRSGETLLVTCTDDKDKLGQKFFRNAANTKQKILLVRLAQTQVDFSFSDD